MNKTRILSVFVALTLCVSSYAQNKGQQRMLPKTDGSIFDVKFDADKYYNDMRKSTFVSESTNQNQVDRQYIKFQTEKLEQDMKFAENQKKVLHDTEGKYTVKQYVQAALNTMYSASSNPLISDGDRFGAVLAVEYVFANQLMSASDEKDVWNKAAAKLFTYDSSAGWAGILLAVLSNYYPPENYNPSAQSPYLKGAEYYPSHRTKEYRKNLFGLMKTIIPSSIYSLDARMGLARGLGYVKPESDAVDIIEDLIKDLNSKVFYEETRRDVQVNQVISDLLEASTSIDDYVAEGVNWAFGTDVDLSHNNYKPGHKFDPDSNNALVASILFQSLAFIHTTQNHEYAKTIIMNYMRWSNISDKYGYDGSSSFTLGVYATMAAAYYGIGDCHDYLAELALWHAGPIYAGIGAVPLEISQIAYNLIPEYKRKWIVDKKIPDGYSHFEYVDGKAVRILDTGIGENIYYNIYGGVRAFRDALLAFVAFDLLAWGVVGALYGAETAAVYSFFAADMGAVLAARSGATALSMYEFTLMVNQRLAYEAFVSTTAGKVTETVLMKPLNAIFNKFGGTINRVKSLVFKNKRIGYNAAVVEQVAPSIISRFGGNNPFPTQQMEMVVPGSGTSASHTIYVNTASTAAKISPNTYVLTADDFVNFARNTTPMETQSIASTVEAITPRHASAYMNTLNQSTRAGTNLSTVSVMSGDVLTTITPALVNTVSGTAITGFRITSTFKTDSEVVNLNKVYYSENGDIVQMMNLEFADEVTVPLLESELDDIERMMSDYKKYCVGAAA